MKPFIHNLLLLPSVLARGFERGIYSRNVHTYVSVTLRNVNLCSRARSDVDELMRHMH